MVRIHIIPRTAEQKKMYRKFATSSTKTGKIAFTDRLHLFYGTCQWSLKQDLNTENFEFRAQTANQVEAAINLLSKNMAVLTAVVSHPPYLPDTVPCDFLPFPRMKLQLWWCHFQDVPKIWELLIIQQNSKSV